MICKHIFETPIDKPSVDRTCAKKPRRKIDMESFTDEVMLEDALGQVKINIVQHLDECYSGVIVAT